MKKNNNMKEGGIFQGISTVVLVLMAVVCLLSMTHMEEHRFEVVVFGDEMRNGVSVAEWPNITLMALGDNVDSVDLGNTGVSGMQNAQEYALRVENAGGVGQPIRDGDIVVAETNDWGDKFRLVSVTKYFEAETISNRGDFILKTESGRTVYSSLGSGDYAADNPEGIDVLRGEVEDGDEVGVKYYFDASEHLEESDPPLDKSKVDGIRRK